MLRGISIENYAIISKVELDFDSSLNIITGETGAGKSIILGALGLIMGQRADVKILLDKKSKCIVEAIFVDYPSHVNTILTDNDLDTSPELIIRREIIPSGRSRAFINDTPTTLGILQKISEELIDLNQQFQITEIQKKDFQLNIIDALAGTEKQLKEYKNLYQTYKSDVKELEEQQALESSQLKELDFMRFQLDELSTAGLAANEKETMESEIVMLGKADDITSLMAETKFKLKDSPTNVSDILFDLSKRWSDYKQVNDNLSDGYDKMEELNKPVSYTHLTLPTICSV